MSSAIDTKKIEEAHEQRIFESMVEQFFKRWAPDDPYERPKFNAEFYGLVRRIYMDAQAPVLEQLTRLAMHAPFPPMIIPGNPASK